MPECLDNMPWRSLKGLGDMAPDFLRLGDFKNVRLKDDTLVQFRIIGFKHDVTKSGRILPLTWEMVDCLPNRHRWNSNDTNRGSWGATELFHKMNDEDGVIYQLMPDEILDVVEPVIKLTANTYDGANELLETECKFWIKSEKETFGRNIYSAPGEGHWYEYYRQEDVPWGKKRNGSAEYTMLRSPYSDDSLLLLLCEHGRQRELLQRKVFLWRRPGFQFLICVSKASAPRKWCKIKQQPLRQLLQWFLCPQWLQPPRGVGG